MQSASDTLSKALIISNWCKHHARCRRGGGKWIGHTRLLAEVPIVQVEYSEVKKIPSRVGFPQVPRATVFTYPEFLTYFYLKRRLPTESECQIMSSTQV